MANPIYCIFWFIILWPAFIVAGFCAPFYILFNAIAACIPACSGLCDVLLQGVQCPGYCANKMVNCQGC